MGPVSKSLLVSMLLLPTLGQTAVPVDQEPRHRVVFENPYVRVIDAALPPGDTTLFHTHSRDNVPVAISAGRMRVQIQGQSASETQVGAGQIWFAQASYTHQIHNSGETALRFIDAEIVSSSGAAANVPRLDKAAGLKLELENDQVRIYRVKLEPGHSTGMHTHSLPRLSVVIREATIRTASAHGSGAMDVEPADYGWHLPGRHSVENIGDDPYEAIEIEWK